MAQSLGINHSDHYRDERAAESGGIAMADPELAERQKQLIARMMRRLGASFFEGGKDRQRRYNEGIFFFFGSIWLTTNSIERDRETIDENLASCECVRAEKLSGETRARLGLCLLLPPASCHEYRPSGTSQTCRCRFYPSPTSSQHKLGERALKKHFTFLFSPLLVVVPIKAFVVAGLHRAATLAKPFNPLLGETYQAQWQDGTRIFLEQSSHHPPVSHWIARHPKASQLIKYTAAKPSCDISSSDEWR